MPRRNGSNPVSAGQAAGEFRKRAAVLRDDAVELGHAGKHLAGETIHRVRQSAEDYYLQGCTKARAIETTVEDYVRSYPIRSLLMAAGAGYILAKLLGRR
jgi:ElaB/YqjD/DUF883 family membrane-anchored ribosome-binding protein